jgi:hypothetical protein
MVLGMEESKIEDRSYNNGGTPTQGPVGTGKHLDWWMRRLVRDTSQHASDETLYDASKPTTANWMQKRPSPIGNVECPFTESM